MGAPKQKWTSEEEEALRAGVAKHGLGKWKNIQKDPEFNTCLAARSNIDLKDKWRNMSVSASGPGSREKVRTPKVKPAPILCITDGRDATKEKVAETSKKPSDGKNAPRYNALIFEALSTIKEPDGSDTNAILDFIEQRHEVPQNFRRLLTSKLRRLVGQEKLEKVENCYKIKKDISFGTRTPTPKQKDIRPRQLLTGVCTTVEEAASNAAYCIAAAEFKSYMASDAVKVAEEFAEKAEEADSLLQLAKEILEQCSKGEIVLMA